MSDIVDTLLYAAKMAHETNVLSRLNDTDLVDAVTEIKTLRSENSDQKALIDKIRATKPDDYSEDFFELLAIRDFISKFDEKNSASTEQSDD